MAENDTTALSDEAMAVFAFAAYHQLDSGQPVRSVIAKDGAGHEADAAALRELADRGLVELRGNDIVFTGDGLSRLGRAIEAFTSAARYA